MQIHGWTIYFHACFEAQLNTLLTDVQRLAAKKPRDYQQTNAFKRLAAIAKLAFDQIPRNPADPAYRQGDTLGKDHKHWFRAKFFQQYRLFFRFSEADRVIVYAWVNDDQTLRAYGSKCDAYATFAKMLSSGQPPDSWKTLIAAKISAERTQELANLVNALQAAPE